MKKNSLTKKITSSPVLAGTTAFVLAISGMLGISFGTSKLILPKLYGNQPTITDEITLDDDSISDENGIVDYTTVEDISGTVSWVDDKIDERPESVEVTLRDDMGNTVRTADVSADTNWQYSFKNIETIDRFGLEKVYSVSEDGADSYAYTVQGYDIVNTADNNGMKDVSVNLIWDDSNNRDNLRPKHATVYINFPADTYEDDENILDSVESAFSWESDTDSNIHSRLFTDIIDYSKYSYDRVWNVALDIEDDLQAALEYEFSYDISGDSKNNQTVTITCKHNPYEKNLKLINIWEDNDNEDGLRPKEIKIDLLGSIESDTIPGKMVTVCEEEILISQDEYDKCDLKEDKGITLYKYAAGKEIVYNVVAVDANKQYDDNYETILDQAQEANIREEDKEYYPRYTIEDVEAIEDKMAVIEEAKTITFNSNSPKDTVQYPWSFNKELYRLKGDSIEKAIKVAENELSVLNGYELLGWTREPDPLKPERYIPEDFTGKVVGDDNIQLYPVWKASFWAVLEGTEGVDAGKTILQFDENINVVPTVNSTYNGYKVLSVGLMSDLNKKEYQAPDPILEDGLVTIESSTPWINSDEDRELMKTVDAVRVKTQLKPTSMMGWFKGGINISEWFGLDQIDTSQCKSMYDTFFMCEQLDLSDESIRRAIEKWDTSKVQSFQGMFHGCKQLAEKDSVDLSNFLTEIETDSAVNFDEFLADISCPKKLYFNMDTSKAYTMRGLFRSSNITEIEFGPKFTTANTHILSLMFGMCSNLVRIDGITNDRKVFDTRQVENMQNMFTHCQALGNFGTDTAKNNIYLTSFNFSNVINKDQTDKTNGALGLLYKAGSSKIQNIYYNSNASAGWTTGIKNVISGSDENPSEETHKGTLVAQSINTQGTMQVQSDGLIVIPSATNDESNDNTTNETISSTEIDNSSYGIDVQLSQHSKEIIRKSGIIVTRPVDSGTAVVDKENYLAEGIKRLFDMKQTFTVIHRLKQQEAIVSGHTTKPSEPVIPDVENPPVKPAAATPPVLVIDPYVESKPETKAAIMRTGDDFMIISIALAISSIIGLVTYRRTRIKNS